MGAEVVFLPTAEDSEQARDSCRILAPWPIIPVSAGFS